MRIPNLFIFGAPKCGTTSVAKYLGDHPNIFMSYPKEIHYFSDDLPGHQIVKTWDDYLDLFKSAGDNVRILGEASVFYLYSEVAAKNIYKVQPDAKIIVMLRNPVDLVHSLHNQLLITLNEDEPDLTTAWDAQAERMAGKRIPKSCKDPKLLQYKLVASYAQQLNRLLKFFPEEQIKVILFDDFKLNPARIYEDILVFLDLPSDGRSNFEDYNPTGALRSKMISKILLLDKPIYIRKLWKFIKTVTGATEKTGESIGKWIEEKNFHHKQRKELRENERQRIAESFKEEIEELEKIINRDLTSWKEYCKNHMMA